MSFPAFQHYDIMKSSLAEEFPCFVAPLCLSPQYGHASFSIGQATIFNFKGKLT